MMALMEQLTDRPNWREVVSDDEAIAAWREEMLTRDERPLFDAILKDNHVCDDIRMPQTQRIITDRIFTHCIMELRSKAKFSRENGFWYTLNFEGNHIIKSDSLVPPDLGNSLKSAFEKLIAEQGDKPNWRPGTGNRVRDLVHPSSYPFVYDRTKFMRDEAVGVRDAIDRWLGTDEGERVPKDTRPSVRALEDEEDGYAPDPEDEDPRGDGLSPRYWSDTYQWLPSNMVFAREDDALSFTSYINNLHPKKYPEIYEAIEGLVGLAIPAWDHALHGYPCVDCRPQTDRRRRKGGVAVLTRTATLEEVYAPLDADALARYEAEHGPIDIGDDEQTDDANNRRAAATNTEADPKTEEEARLRRKWYKIAEPPYAEPLRYQRISYELDRSLYEEFGDTGLQVVVKMTSIELAPEQNQPPERPAGVETGQGEWQVEGHTLNERIVASAVYYVDSENMTSASAPDGTRGTSLGEISFRMEATTLDLNDRCCGDLLRYYTQIHGTHFWDDEWRRDAFQRYGSITIPGPGTAGKKDGENGRGINRFIAFPNSFQHRVPPASSYRLMDPARPGYLRFITLGLVDPHRRVISTANVAPQQMGWWAEAVFGTTAEGLSRGSRGGLPGRGSMPPELFRLLLERGAFDEYQPKQQQQPESIPTRLPPEILEIIRTQGVLADGLMAPGEAAQHRAAMAERRTFIEMTHSTWEESNLGWFTRFGSLG